MPKVMLVEDDIPLAQVVRDYLRQYGYEVLVEQYGDIAAKRIIAEQPDAVLLDINLPRIDGFQVCRRVRAAYRGVIIMLTARSADVDEVLGLESGADDYLTKPVRPNVLRARLSVHLLRNNTAVSTSEDLFQLGPLRISRSRHYVELYGQSIDLTTAEYNLLMLLARNPGTTIHRADLFAMLNPGEPYDYRDRSIDLRISRLRKKLHDDPQHPKLIRSIRGTGYMLVLPQ